jgi:hypothetical protein
MKNYFIGFVSASVVWIVILHFVEVPEYIVYDCDEIHWNTDAPEDVIEFCSRKKSNKGYRT